MTARAPAPGPDNRPPTTGAVDPELLRLIESLARYNARKDHARHHAAKA